MKTLKQKSHWVTKSNISDYERCPYAFWLFDSGRLYEDKPFDTEEPYTPYESQAATSGMIFERGVIAGAIAARTGVPKNAPPRCNMLSHFNFEQTLIQNNKLKIAGIPDGFEPESFAPLEIKYRFKAVKMDRYELAFYWLLLSEIRKSSDVEPHGYLQLFKPAPERISLTPADFRYVHALIDGVRKARAIGVKPRLCDCLTCIRREEVQKINNKGKDVRHVFGIGLKQARALYGVGVESVKQLADANASQLQEQLQSSNLRVSLSAIEVWQHHAQAMRKNRVIRFSNARFEHEEYMTLDLEYQNDRFLIGEGGVWLVGIKIVHGKKSRVVQMWCDTPFRRRKVAQKVTNLLKKHIDLPIVTWSGNNADIPQLLRFLRGQRPKALKIEQRHFDMYNIVRSSLRFPIPTLKLKALAAWMEIPVHSKISDGLGANSVFDQFKCSGSKVVRERLRRQLLTYNKDDLDILTEVVDFCRTK